MNEDSYAMLQLFLIDREECLGMISFLIYLT